MRKKVFKLFQKHLEAAGSKFLISSKGVVHMSLQHGEDKLIADAFPTIDPCEIEIDWKTHPRPVFVLPYELKGKIDPPENNFYIPNKADAEAFVIDAARWLQGNMNLLPSKTLAQLRSQGVNIRDLGEYKKVLFEYLAFLRAVCLADEELCQRFRFCGWQWEQAGVREGAPVYRVYYLPFEEDSETLNPSVPFWILPEDMCPDRHELPLQLPSGDREQLIGLIEQCPNAAPAIAAGILGILSEVIRPLISKQDDGEWEFGVNLCTTDYRQALYAAHLLICPTTGWDADKGYSLNRISKIGWIRPDSLKFQWVEAEAYHHVSLPISTATGNRPNRHQLRKLMGLPPLPILVTHRNANLDEMVDLSMDDLALIQSDRARSNAVKAAINRLYRLLIKSLAPKLSGVYCKDGISYEKLDMMASRLIAQYQGRWDGYNEEYIRQAAFLGTAWRIALELVVISSKEINRLVELSEPAFRRIALRENGELPLEKRKTALDPLEALTCYTQRMFIDQEECVAYRWAIQEERRFPHERCLFVEYDAFLKDFFERYPLCCHSSELLRLFADRKILKRRTNGASMGMYRVINGERLYCLVIRLKNLEEKLKI